jgi:nitric oxide reductase NorQ protein
MAYIAVDQEAAIFAAAAAAGLPVLLKGPTGCGKTRLVESMALSLGRPLFTVACHEDLTAGDLVGRFLLRGGETVWEDGPLTRAVRTGGICYLDEIVEARSDTTVVIHPLADHRRTLNIERLGEVLIAPPGFMLVLTYNPGYQSVLKELKPSTRQRMVAIELQYPPAEIEIRILVQESGIDTASAERFVRLGRATRMLQAQGLNEGASTRALISAGKLLRAGLDPVAAGEVAIVQPLSDDPATSAALRDMVKLYCA